MSEEGGGEVYSPLESVPKVKSGTNTVKTGEDPA